MSPFYLKEVYFYCCEEQLGSVVNYYCVCGCHVPEIDVCDSVEQLYGASPL